MYRGKVYTVSCRQLREYLAICLPAFSPETVHRDST
jgi:hypothetical protein